MASETSVSRVADSFGDSVPGVSESLLVFPPLFFETLAGSDVILPHYRCATTHFQSGPQKKPTTTHTPGTEPQEPRSL